MFNFNKYYEDILSLTMQDECELCNISNLLKRGIKKIVICGMGGSAIAGEFARAIYKSLDIEVFKDYFDNNVLSRLDIKKTLFIIISYSGNTEESLSWYSYLVKKTKKIVAITSGGKFEKLAKKNGTLICKVKGGYQPRAALGMLLKSLNIIFSQFLGKKELKLAKLSGKDIEKIDALAKSIAKKILSKIPVVYSFKQNFSLGYRLKTQLNENAKKIAFFNLLPEANHNEIQALLDKRAKEFVFIILVQKNLQAKYKKILSALTSIYDARSIKYIVLEMFGSLSKNILLVDLISFHCANLAKINPENIKLIEEFKKKL